MVSLLDTFLWWLLLALVGYRAMALIEKVRLLYLSRYLRSYCLYCSYCSWLLILLSTFSIEMDVVDFLVFTGTFISDVYSDSAPKPPYTPLFVLVLAVVIVVVATGVEKSDEFCGRRCFPDPS